MSRYFFRPFQSRRLEPITTDSLQLALETGQVWRDMLLPVPLSGGFLYREAHRLCPHQLPAVAVAERARQVHLFGRLNVEQSLGEILHTQPRDPQRIYRCFRFESE